MVTARTPGTISPRLARTERLAMRIDPEEKAVLELAARLQQQSLSDFVLSIARREAERIVNEHQAFQLSERDTRAFVEALLNPPPFSFSLEQAMERHSRLYGDG
jgi:uncharacterized protein (DUF1778 family)